MGNGVTFRHFGQYEKSGADTYAEAGQYIQTFRSSRAFKLKKLKLGLYNHGANYKGRLRVKLLATWLKAPCPAWPGAARESRSGSQAGRPRVEYTLGQKRSTRSNSMPRATRFQVLTPQKPSRMWISKV